MTSHSKKRLITNRKDKDSMWKNSLMALIALCAWSGNGASEATHYDSPLVTIGTSGKFTVDGRISENERKHAAGMYGFCRWTETNPETAPLFPAEARFYIACDGKNLYLAAECETGPDGILERLGAGMRGPRVFTMDDTFEFVISPDPASGDFYHLMLNNKGAYFSTARKNGTGVVWNPVFLSKGTVEKGIWTMETMLPLEQFGVTPPLEGREIGLRFCRNWQRIARHYDKSGLAQSCWSHRSVSFEGCDSIPRIRFRTGAPSIRFTELTRDGKPAPAASIFNPGAPVRLRVRYALNPSASQSVDSKTVLELGTGEEKKMNLPVPQLTPGETARLFFEVASEDEKDIFWRRVFTWDTTRRKVFEKTGSTVEKISLKFAFYPSSNRLFCRLDLSALEHPEKEPLPAAEVFGKNGEKLVSGVFPALRNGQSELLLRLPDLREYTRKRNPSGEYRLEVMAGGEKIIKKFERKLFAWEDNRIGMSDILIPPFTAIKVDGFRVSTILREHEMSPAGLWRQVTAEGEPLLLDGGITLAAKIGGETFRVRGEGVRFTRCTETAVEGRADWSCGPLKGRTRFRYDYDGMMKCELEFEGNGVRADALELRIPMDEKNAYLFHACADGLRQNYGGRTPARWNSIEAPKFSLRTSWCPYLWLGTEGRGLSVFGENDRNWSVSKDVPAQSLVREKGKVVLTLNLFAEPVVLNAPRVITLGFQATPVKPMPPHWRRRFAAWDAAEALKPYLDYWISWYGSSYCEGGIGSSLHPRDYDLSIWRELAETRKTKVIPEKFLKEWLKGYSRFPSPNWETMFRNELNYGFNTAKKSVPGSVTFYTNLRGQRLDIAESKTFLDDWFKEEFQPSRDREPEYSASLPYSVDPVKSYRDYAIYWNKKMLESGACDNLYWDNVFPSPNYDRSGTGDTYLLSNGEIQPSTGFFNMREMIRRGAVMQLEMNRLPNNTAHMTNVAAAPLLAFAQQNLDWEDHLGTSPFQKRYTREYIRAVSLGRQFGNLPVVIGLVKMDDARDAVAFCMRTGTGVALTHETQWCKGSQFSKVYNSILLEFYRFGYGTDGVEVRNYWDKDYPVHVSGGDTSSILLRKGRNALLVVCNYGNDAEPSVRIDGMKILSAVNGENGSSLAVRGGAISFPLKKYDFIFIKLKGN